MAIAMAAPSPKAPPEMARWNDSVGAFQDAMKVQAGVVTNMGATRQSIGTLVTASQSATECFMGRDVGTGGEGGTVLICGGHHARQRHPHRTHASADCSLQPARSP